MSRPTIEIIEPGMLTTVQDRGRYGYQRYGVPVCGAMDEFALRAANLLVGNDEGAAGLEITVTGPTIRFLTDTWIAVTGADISPLLDGGPLGRWESVQARKDSILTFQEPKDGMRAYLAVAGGLDVPAVMGSRSTYVKAGLGGLEGRPLRRGDVLSSLPLEQGAEMAKRRLPAGYGAPTYGDDHVIRVALGPQHQAFDEEAIATFLSSMYIVAQDSDRMGYRLEGSPVGHKDSPDIVSDGNPLGAVQIPGDGMPRVLLADRGTTGGYAKIATVISVDVGTLAQALPGHTVMFKAVTPEEAQQVLREREDVLTAIASGEPVRGGPDLRISVLVNGEAFEVVSEDGEVLSHVRPPIEGAGSKTYQAEVTVKGQSYEFQVEVKKRK